MFSNDTIAVFKRLLILALLSICLLVFGSSFGSEIAYAAPCIKDCETQEAYCYDQCVIDCNGNGDAVCNSCISACASDFRNCARHAEWCESGTMSYAPKCQIYYTDHCPTVDPACPGGHSGYTLVCQRNYGNCVSCPDEPGWSCWGSGGTPPC
jgi:hypothetical protein